ncbi:MAG: diguanylate cyclase [Acidobacteria bacterium]|nr:diguanylate cyclase [Acidobacteriota bacterium]
MEPGTLELQIFVSLIVVLGAAFVALVCDYLKGNNETLREHNIELRVRKEEQDKQRPAEAAEWLQSLLGAKQRNPVRFGKMRPARGGVEARGAEARPAEARAEAKAADGRRPLDREAAAKAADPVPIPSMRGPLRSHVHVPPVTPAATHAPAGHYPDHTEEYAANGGGQRGNHAPAQPSRPAPNSEPVVAPPLRVPLVAQVVAQMSEQGVMTQVQEVAATTEPQSADESRKSILAEARSRRQGRPSSAPGLLESLPVPAWVKKEQEERAARAKREWEQVEAPHADSPKVPEAAVLTEAAPVADASSQPDNFWTYKGLLDRVVAATTHKPPVVVEDSQPKPAFAAALAWASRKPAVNPSLLVDSAAPPAVVSETAANAEDAVAGTAAPVVVQPVAESVEEISTVAVDVPSGPMQESFAADEPVRPVTVVHADAEPASDESLTPLYETYEEWAAAQAKLVGMSFGQESPEETARVEVESETVQTAVEPLLLAPVASVDEEQERGPSLPAVPELSVPDGFHDKSVLQQLIQSPDVLTGVVVAIGINEYAHQLEKLGASSMADLMRSVEGMITGLLRPGMDFACRSSEDEFILIFPKETGAAAQRRLTSISERLWNFQLRSISNFSVLFSWGAVEVQAETLADAAAGASERMYQTKRTRKTVTLDPHRRKLAV